MPVSGHDQRTAVIVAELDADIEVREAEFQKLGCCEVSEVVPSGPWEPRSGSYSPPGVVMRTLH